MAAPRTTLTPDKQALKRNAQALVKAVGGVEAAEGFCRAGFRRLSEYQRPDNECFMPVDVVADLEAIAHGTAGFPQVTSELARRAGFALVRLPDDANPTGRDLCGALVDCIREAGELHAAMAAALGDGRVDSAERVRVRTEAIQAAEANMRLVALLDQMGGE